MLVWTLSHQVTFVHVTMQLEANQYNLNSDDTSVPLHLSLPKLGYSEMIPSWRHTTKTRLLPPMRRSHYYLRRVFILCQTWRKLVCPSIKICRFHSPLDKEGEHKFKCKPENKVSMSDAILKPVRACAVTTALDNQITNIFSPNQEEVSSHQKYLNQIPKGKGDEWIKKTT